MDPIGSQESGKALYMVYVNVAAGPRPPVEDIISGVKEECSFSSILCS